MKLDGFEISVANIPKTIRFYRDVLGIEIKEIEDTPNVCLVKKHIILMYGRKRI